MIRLVAVGSTTSNGHTINSQSGRATRNAASIPKKLVGVTHGSSANISGTYYNIVPYGVDENGFIDYEFNCCDVMIILDRLNMNERFFKRFLS